MVVVLMVSFVLKVLNDALVLGGFVIPGYVAVDFVLIFGPANNYLRKSAFFGGFFNKTYANVYPYIVLLESLCLLFFTIKIFILL